MIFAVLMILLCFPGPAPDNVTTEIFDISVRLASYKIVPGLECDIDTQGVYAYMVSSMWHSRIELRACFLELIV
jgi:hypothetical protein